MKENLTGSEITATGDAPDPIYRERDEAEVAELLHEQGEAEYVLVADKYPKRYGDDVTYYKRGDLVPLNVSDAKRLLAVWAVEPIGSRAARTAQMEATNDEAERARLRAEEIEDQIKALQAEKEKLDPS